MNEENRTSAEIPDNPYLPGLLPGISIQKWGVEAGLHFFNTLQKQIDFKRKFRVVLEHDPGEPTVVLNFHYEDGSDGEATKIETPPKAHMHEIVISKWGIDAELLTNRHKSPPQSGKS